MSCHGVPVVPNVIYQRSRSGYHPAWPAVRLHALLRAAGITESSSVRLQELTVSMLETTLLRKVGAARQVPGILSRAPSQR